MCVCVRDWLVVKFQVALSTSNDHLYPDAHDFAWWRHQVKVSVECFNHKGGLGIGRLDCAHVVNVDLVDRLKVDAATQLRLMSVHVVAESALLTVEHKPPLVPGLELLAHLEQVAAARMLINEHERLLCAWLHLVHQLMPAVFHVVFQVKVVVAHWQISCQRSRLE